jgi:acetylornithine deacetylase/succinyl-diaminopimelate desuccinylase-like protein
VQPVGDIDKWKNEPFTPKVIDGRLFGRGSGDNKAGVVVHYEVAKALIDDLPVNIKFLLKEKKRLGPRVWLSF